MTEEHRPAPRRRIQKEHLLQRGIVHFCRDAVEAVHFFMAFDRSAPTSKLTHMAEAARGIRPGTPDTVLLVSGHSPIWAELKYGANKPSDAQKEVASRLVDLGNHWACIYSVVEYHDYLADIGIPMRPNAKLIAMHHDGRVAATIDKAEAKKSTPRVAKGKTYNQAGRGFAKRARGILT